jgi:hypothetical protein
VKFHDASLPRNVWLCVWHLADEAACFVAAGPPPIHRIVGSATELVICKFECLTHKTQLEESEPNRQLC